MRPKYAVIENVKGLLSKGLEIVLQDLSAIGYDAEWQCVSASAFGSPHLRERVFIVAYPHGARVDDKCRVFTTNMPKLVNNYQFGNVSDWLGVRIDRTDKKAIRHVYGGPVLYRVDDGSAEGLDESPGQKPSLDRIPFIDKDTHKRWLPRLKALGNGILPYQSEYVACCILQAEGLSPPV